MLQVLIRPWHYYPARHAFHHHILWPLDAAIPFIMAWGSCRIDPWYQKLALLYSMVMMVSSYHCQKGEAQSEYKEKNSGKGFIYLRICYMSFDKLSALARLATHLIGVVQCEPDRRKLEWLDCCCCCCGCWSSFFGGIVFLHVSAAVLVVVVDSTAVLVVDVDVSRTAFGCCWGSSSSSSILRTSTRSWFSTILRRILFMYNDKALLDSCNRRLSSDNSNQKVEHGPWLVGDNAYACA